VSGKQIDRAADSTAFEQHVFREVARGSREPLRHAEVGREHQVNHVSIRRINLANRSGRSELAAVRSFQPDLLADIISGVGSLRAED
jgi:hypothetical protein